MACLSISRAHNTLQHSYVHAFVCNILAPYCWLGKCKYRAMFKRIWYAFRNVSNARHNTIVIDFVRCVRCVVVGLGVCQPKLGFKELCWTYLRTHESPGDLKVVFGSLRPTRCYSVRICRGYSYEGNISIYCVPQRRRKATSLKRTLYMQSEGHYLILVVIARGYCFGGRLGALYVRTAILIISCVTGSLLLRGNLWGNYLLDQPRPKSGTLCVPILRTKFKATS